MGLGGEDDELRWLAHTLSVFSRRITRRIFCVSLCCSNRASPVPRSFHSFPSELNRKSFARLGNARGRKVIRGVPEKMSETQIGREGDIQLEDYSLVLFVRLCYNLFCELDDGFKVRVMFFLRLSQTSSMVNCMANAGVWGGRQRTESADLWCQWIQGVGHNVRWWWMRVVRG
jgi:hypothetical protein